MSKELPPYPESWGAEETCQYLEIKGYGKYTNEFKEKKITAVSLRYETADGLAMEGIGSLNDCMGILMCIRELWQTTVPGKVFNDPIHGHMELHPLLVKIIDTPQFQRLRNIKQLGGAYFVFPGASHNRFEHSVGVGYLAGRLAQILRTKQPELNITPEDVLCVQIAGLCHELGQGPFSSMYERMFIPKACPQDNWMRDEASGKIFEHLVKENNLESVMKDYKLDLTKDLLFIKEMIQGPLNNDAAQSVWPYEGRSEDKSFLYEIVANKRNGIDVDKFDYLARDSYYLGVQGSFDYRRCLRFVRVCKCDDDKLHICFRDKEVGSLYDMFHTRNYLYRNSYLHKVTKIIEIMMRDAFLKADKHIKIEGKGGKMFTLSTAKDDPEAFTKLTDCVFEKILNFSQTLPEEIQKRKLEELDGNASAQLNQEEKEACMKRNEEMAEASEILNRIITRKIYKFLGTRDQTEKPTEEQIELWKQELAQSLPQGDQGDTDPIILSPESFEIVYFTMDFGKTDEDLIENTYFFTKKDPSTPFMIPKQEVSMFLPKRWSEKFIRVWYKSPNDEVGQAAKKSFEQWCRPSQVATEDEDEDKY